MLNQHFDQKSAQKVKKNDKNLKTRFSQNLKTTSYHVLPWRSSIVECGILLTMIVILRIIIIIMIIIINNIYEVAHLGEIYIDRIF